MYFVAHALCKSAGEGFRTFINCSTATRGLLILQYPIQSISHKRDINQLGKGVHEVQQTSNKR